MILFMINYHKPEVKHEVARAIAAVLNLWAATKVGNLEFFYVSH